jgi:hypothetical protein
MEIVKAALIDYCSRHPHDIVWQGNDTYIMFPQATSYLIMSSASNARTFAEIFAHDTKVVGVLPQWPPRLFSFRDRLLIALDSKRIRFTMHCDCCGEPDVKTPLCEHCIGPERIPQTMALLRTVLCRDVVDIIWGLFLLLIDSKK